MSGLLLSRHELRWVLEQAGAPCWPYPLRSPAWSAETDTETARHRDQVEGALHERGLLEPGPARVLLRAGGLVARWRSAADLVRRDATAPCAAVVVTDGTDAVALVSTEHADAPVRVVPAPADRMPETLLGLVPRVPAGSGGPWPLPGPAPHGAGPTTDRAASARAVVDDLLARTDAATEVGVATWRDGASAPVRAPVRVSWLDGPRGRFAVRRPPPGVTRPAVIVGVNDDHLLADIHTVLGEAETEAGLSGPRHAGRSTA